ncbi:sialidase family protein [Streptomyces afghaniensis]|uniref:sialidase family protein n=1 Tax=Streptomyces afghaniensis TaxID=66865 RepID=UPI0033B34F16
MNHRRAWPVLLTALALTLLSGLLLPGPASAEGTSSESTVYTNIVTGGDGPRTPDIISTSANNAVVAWREGLRPGNRDMGYIRYSYTTDGGAHWSRPATLAQETSEYAWHYVILYQAGSDLFAFLGRTPIADPTESDGINHNGVPINGTFVKRSTDEGHTWQDHPATFPSIGNLVFAGRPVKLESGLHAIPYWATQRENGVLVSSDLKSWTKRGTVDGGPQFTAGEPQLTFAQSDSAGEDELFMVARAENAQAVTSTSPDGGRTWSDFALDANVPSHNSKVYFTKDSNGRYLAIYNTATDRKVLNYKVRSPGAAWGAGRFFADGPAVTSGDGAGWDVYAMADEYAPGKFFVVWEHDTSAIKVNKLDISSG